MPNLLIFPQLDPSLGQLHPLSYVEPMRVLESKSVVPGGGCVEAALSIYLENLATSLVSINGVFLIFH